MCFLREIGCMCSLSFVFSMPLLFKSPPASLAKIKMFHVFKMPCDISGESQCTDLLTSFFINLKKERTELLTDEGKKVHFTENSRI